MAIDTRNNVSDLENKPETVIESERLNGSRNDYTAAAPPLHPYPPYTRPAAQGSWARGVTSPIVVLFVAFLVMIGMLSFGAGASLAGKSSTASTDTTSSSSSSSSSSSMSMGSASTTTASVPNATQSYGNQLAPYVIDPDGAKHFTLTAYQVMWEPVKGQRVLAWTINGTVPGPMIRVTAGDHVRITFINHFPEATSIHWHGLLVPSDQDGVPGVGNPPIQPGQTYVYDFTVHDWDVGTHWYHSHYDDVTQVPGGFYGAFLVDPRLGTPQYTQYTQAFKADVEATLFMSELTGGYYVIDGKSFPDTQPIHVKHGQTVHLRIIGAGEMIHPMHLHGHFFNLVAEDGHLLPAPITEDTLEVVPGKTYDLTFYAWAPPGSVYPFHCHILAHVMNPGQTGDEMGGLIDLIEYAK